MRLFQRSRIQQCLRVTWSIAIVAALSALALLVSQSADPAKALAANGASDASKDSAQIGVAESSSADAPAFVITKGGTLDLATVVNLYCEARALPAVMQNRSGLLGYATSVPTPAKSTRIDALQLMQSMLSRVQSVAIEVDGVLHIVDASEAGTLPAPVVDAETIADQPAWQYVRFVGRLKYIAPDYFRVSAQNLLTRHSGMFIPTQSRRGEVADSYIITDFACNVRRILEIIERIDVLEPTISDKISIGNADPKLLVQAATRSLSLNLVIDEASKEAIYSVPESKREWARASLQSLLNTIPQEREPSAPGAD